MPSPAHTLVSRPPIAAALLKSLSGTFLLSILIRGTAALAALGANVVLARMLGASEYGRYMTVYSAAVVLGSIAVRGTDQLLTRELSAGAALNATWRRKLNAWLARHVTVGVAAALAVYVFWKILFHRDASPWLADAGALALIGLCSTSMLLAGALNGLGASQRSQSLVPLANNSVVLALLGALWLGFGRPIDSESALYLQVLGYAFSCGLGVYWLRASGVMFSGQPTGSSPQEEKDSRASDWSLSSRHFLYVALASVVVSRLDVVLVEMLTDSRTAGIYVAGARLAQVALLIAIAVNTALSPKISAAWSRKEYANVRRLVNKALLFTAIVATVEVAVAAAFATDVVRLLGGAYGESARVFTWIAAAYAIWTLAAPYYALLSMIGHERTTAALSLAVSTINVVSVILLVPIMGATGAAVAMAIGFACVLPALVLRARRCLAERARVS